MKCHSPFLQPEINEVKGRIAFISQACVLCTDQHSLTSIIKGYFWSIYNLKSIFATHQFISQGKYVLPSTIIAVLNHPYLQMTQKVRVEVFSTTPCGSCREELLALCCSRSSTYVYPGNICSSRSVSCLKPRTLSLNEGSCSSKQSADHHRHPLSLDNLQNATERPLLRHCYPNSTTSCLCS